MSWETGMVRRACILLAGWCGLAAWSAWSAGAAEAPTRPTTTRAAWVPSSQPFRGVGYRAEVRADPPMRLHIVTLDLADPGLQVSVVRAPDPDGAGPWQTTLQTVRTLAQHHDLDLAINGDFFLAKNTMELAGRRIAYYAGNWGKACGLAMSDGALWCATPGTALVIDERGKASIGKFDKPPAGARQIMGGGAILLAGGKKVVGPDGGRHPRTAVGLDASGRRLVLLLVDGRRAGYSVGMTTPELADELLRLDCTEGLNLDGGGSTTLVLRDPADGKWRVLNRPSDGNDMVIPVSIERAVVNALGVKVRDPRR